jgi:hypothetical protein
MATLTTLASGNSTDVAQALITALEAAAQLKASLATVAPATAASVTIPAAPAPASGASS